MAPKPENCRPNHFYPVSGPIATNHDGKNMNAFAGSHLGVPAGPLETVTSMDPKDYVWGVPQAQPGLFAGPGFASQPLFAAPQGFFQPQAFGLNGFAQPPVSAPHPSTGATPLQQVQSRPQTCNAETPGTSVSKAMDSSSTAAQPTHPLPSGQAVHEQLQAEASLEQVDDLLNMAFDDDCIKKLLSEPHAGMAPADCNILGSPQAGRSDLHRSGSPCLERTSPGPSHNSASTGCAAAPSPDMLDATDLHFPMEETSVLETMSGFGDLDLHLLEGGLAEVETTSEMAPPDCATVTHSLMPASGSTTRALKRAKSETGTVSNQGSGHYNPLLSLEISDALASINGFLANHASFPEEKRLAAVEAIAALDLIATDVPMALPAEVDPSADAVAALTRASSYPRRKRAPPA